MIRIDAYRAVFDRPVRGLETADHVAIVPQTKNKRTQSPAAQYALAAVSAFDGLEDPALVCLAGPTGSTVSAFEKARNASSDGRLTGPDFPKRAKRIHPFTLVQSLQNGPAAVLSMSLGFTGPCLNALDAGTALADLLPNIAAYLKRRPVLLVAVSAGGREEERSKASLIGPGEEPVEGAVAFLLTQQGGLGYLEPANPVAEAAVSTTDDIASPTLAGAVAILRCIQSQSPPFRQILRLCDPSGRIEHISWRSTAWPT